MISDHYSDYQGAFSHLQRMIYKVINTSSSCVAHTPNGSSGTKG